MKIKKINLLNLIYKDLIENNKLQFLLLCILFFSFNFIVYITHKTRLMNNNLEKYYIEYSILENYYNDLVFEKNILIKYNSIEKIAKEKLNMSFLNEKENNLIMLD